MVDPATRRAAGWAALVAVPLAVLAGMISFALLDGLGGDGPNGADGATASPTPASPRATGPVSMPAPALPGRVEVICRALLSRLPGGLREAPRRPVGAGPGQNAAYGDPPLTVACGVAPARFPPTDRVYRLDAVCWHASADGTVWTTVDREAAVRVTVPRAYDPPGQWVIELSAPVTEAVPSLPAASIPFGCRQ
jgi:hypothetical protein